MNRLKRRHLGSMKVTKVTIPGMAGEGPITVERTRFVFERVNPPDTVGAVGAPRRVPGQEGTPIAQWYSWPAAARKGMRWA